MESKFTLADPFELVVIGDLPFKGDVVSSSDLGSEQTAAKIFLAVGKVVAAERGVDPKAAVVVDPVAESSVEAPVGKLLLLLKDRAVPFESVKACFVGLCGLGDWAIPVEPEVPAGPEEFDPPA